MDFFHGQRDGDASDGTDGDGFEKLFHDGVPFPVDAW